MNLRLFAVVCCLVLAGCAAPAAPSPSPGGDRLGVENGYAATDDLTVDASDGLNESELDAVVARTMARVEVIRRLEFRETVPVEVISREEYLNGSSRDTTVDTPAERAREQRYEAAMLVGEDRTVGGAFAEIYGGSVLGYYSSAADRIVIVSANETPTVDRTTLAHELVHALQDQRLSLLGGAAGPDEGMAHTGVVEGDASYVEARYEQRCGEQWDCIDRPASSSAGGIADRNLGLYLTVYAPYSEGPTFVHRAHQRGGWAAVNDLYVRPPRSSEQLIHPEDYPADRPASVIVPDRSTAAFDRASPTTVGEATLFAMLWQQRAIDRGTLSSDPGPYSAYNYSHPATAGWAGDTLVPYFDADSDDPDADGYVLQTRWESERDARQFARAYRGLLTESLNATADGEGIYRVPEGSFADAFRVTREGRTVRIVNAPTVDALEEVHDPA
ncbi:Hvo_1808 family surface protein [Halolamina sediminis]|uniref:Hvo_1808 family surface protein n=1 Tax=Halolamina sediminis TaxID=1480675 RepID=UPI0006B567A7|nr:Hvo_1808 family surface protein [Halolamina sediminis]